MNIRKSPQSDKETSNNRSEHILVSEKLNCFLSENRIKTKMHAWYYHLYSTLYFSCLENPNESTGKLLELMGVLQGCGEKINIQKLIVSFPLPFPSLPSPPCPHVQRTKYYTNCSHTSKLMNHFTSQMEGEKSKIRYTLLHLNKVQKPAKLNYIFGSANIGNQTIKRNKKSHLYNIYAFF